MLLRAVRLDPTHAASRTLLFDVVSREPKAELAAVLEHLVAVRDDDVQARCELGKLLVRLERPSDAVVQLRAALDLGADPEILALLAEIETGLGENQRAVAAAEQAIASPLLDITIDGATGVLTFVAAPDFDAPADLDGNNVYEVTVEVADGQDNDCNGQTDDGLDLGAACEGGQDQNRQNHRQEPVGAHVHPPGQGKSRGFSC